VPKQSYPDLPGDISANQGECSMSKTSREMVLGRLNQAVERLNGAYGDILGAARMFEPETLVRDQITNCANQLAHVCRGLIAIRDQVRKNGDSTCSGS
jgi:hypothetical protein